MKKLLPIPLIALPLLLYAAIQIPQNITLIWSQENPATTDITYKVYSSTNLSIPIAQWTLIKLVPGTNYQTTISVTPGRAWYSVTASNFWGETDPSNLAGTPPVPVSGSLSIQKGGQ